MTKIKLSRRLQVIAGMVDRRTITDVGCDHGKLTAYLFEHKLIDYAVVSDISEASLGKAITLLYDVKAHFDHVVCDGIYKYANVELAVIAGIGGKEIIKILKNNASNITEFVLAPQHNEMELKKYLVKHKYLMLADIIICDNGKFYNIIRCQKSRVRHNIPTEQMYFGQNVPGADYAKYVDNKYNKVSDIIGTIPYFKSFGMRKYYSVIKRAKNKLENK